MNTKRKRKSAGPGTVCGHTMFIVLNSYAHYLKCQRMGPLTVSM